MRKKVFAITLIIFLLFSAAVPVRAGAAGLAGPFFTAHSNVPAAQGGTVTIPVSVSNNPGFASTCLYVVFDADALEFSAASSPVSAMQARQTAASAANSAQSVSLESPTLADWDGMGVVLNLTFNVLPNAPTGLSFIELSFASSPENAAGNVLLGSVVSSGSVNIVSGNIGAGQDFGVAGNQENETWDDWDDWDDWDEWDEWDDWDDTDDWDWWLGDPADDNRADDGAFIGTPYVPREDTSGLSANPQTAAPLHFGTVPQTSTPNLTIIIAAIVVNFLIIVGLLIGIIYYKKRQQGNE